MFSDAVMIKRLGVYLNYEYNMMSGAFTSALIDYLRFNNHNVSILKLYIDICKWMEEKIIIHNAYVFSTTSTPFYKYLKEQNTNSV